jgi:hypothetical protein
MQCPRRKRREGRRFLPCELGYVVLEGAIPQHLTYRVAMRSGRSIMETGQKTLDGRAERLMADLLQKAMRGKKKRGGRA